MSFNLPTSVWLHALLVSVVGFLVYANSIPNRYALDDQIVITDNPHVQRGIGGIPKILTTDSFDTGLEDELTEAASGGRYRPLSLVTFAVEISLARAIGIGERATASCQHLGNVLLFCLTLVLMVVLTRRLFPETPVIALIAGLLFAVHPVHTEVVANIKSRDEILSLLFLLGTLLASLRLAKGKSTVGYLLPAGLLLLALLAKEYSMAALVLVPLATWIRYGWSRRRFVLELAAIGVVLLIYVGLRNHAVGFQSATATDPLNAPFAGVSALEALATQLSVLGKSLWYMVFPHPLSSNHGYRVIPFRTFSDPVPWVGFLLYSAMTILAFGLSWRRHPLAYGLWFYLLTLFPVSNILVDVGVPFAERFLFHASLGACMVFAWVASKALSHRLTRPLALAGLGVVLLAGAGRTVLRNPEWDRSDRLVLADVESTPRSVFLQYHAGLMHEAAGDFDLAIKAYDACTQLYPQYGEPYPKRCIAHAKVGRFEAAVADFKIASQILSPDERASYKAFLKGQIVRSPVRNVKQAEVFKRLLKEIDDVQ